MIRPSVSSLGVFFGRVFDTYQSCNMAWKGHGGNTRELQVRLKVILDGFRGLASAVRSGWAEWSQGDRQTWRQSTSRHHFWTVFLRKIVHRSRNSFLSAIITFVSNLLGRIILCVVCVWLPAHHGSSCFLFLELCIMICFQIWAEWATYKQYGAIHLENSQHARRINKSNITLESNESLDLRD